MLKHATQIDKKNKNPKSNEVQEKWGKQLIQMLKNPKERERKHRSKQAAQNHPVRHDSKNLMKSRVACTNLRKFPWNSRKNSRKINFLICRTSLLRNCVLKCFLLFRAYIIWNNVSIRRGFMETGVSKLLKYWSLYWWYFSI